MGRIGLPALGAGLLLAGVVACTSTAPTTTTASSSSTVPSSAAPSSSTAPSTSTSSTSPAARAIQVLVTNDDGYGAAGIDAVVQALRGVPDVRVTVVAPATDQSGMGGKTTPGTLTARRVTTKSGYPAEAVDGHPADTITWAIDQHGVASTPDLVISGINAGANLATLVDVSGTVGAARAAVAHGIPALAVSAGAGSPIDYAAAAKQALDWLTAHRAAITTGTLSTTTVASINVPTCPSGAVRSLVVVPLATSLAGYGAPPNCHSTAEHPATDIAAFNDGFATLTQLSARPGS